MGTLRLKNKKEFERLHALGMRSLSNGKFEPALKYFTEADTLARQCGDRRKRLEALNPMAHALWSLGEFDKAKQKLAVAAKIASELGLRDELAIVFSNQGRLEAVKIIKQKPITKQPSALSKESLPHFTRALNLLDGHDHLYFRYANAKHGALVAALAQDYKKSSLLLSDGLYVAFKKSSKFDRETTYQLNPSGLDYFAAAAKLTNLGALNPASRDYKAQEKLARELVK